MTQLTLLQAQSLVLADDPEGGIVYRPGFVSSDRAQSWFEQVRDTVAWQRDRRKMYDREVDVPRLLGHFRLDGEMPAVMREIADVVIGGTAVPFNSVGLNFYRDQHDSVAPHNDHLYDLVAGHPIGLLSLGATRRMVIRGKKAPRTAINVDLEAGSLLTMSHASQLEYLHGVPKQKTPCGQRISLAFRVKPKHRLDRY